MSRRRSIFLSLFRQVAAAAAVLSSLPASADLGVAKGFNAFVEGDFIGVNTDVQGRLAAGGNVELTSYGVATGVEIEPGTSSLIVGGDLTFNYGQVHQGGIWVAGSTDGLGLDVREGMAPGTSIVEGVELPFSIETEFSLLRGISETLSYAESTGSVEYKWGGAYLAGDCESGVQVFQLDGAELDAANSFNLECVPESATVVFNVSGSAPGISYMSLEALRSRSTQILWNFYEADRVNFSNVGVHGSILAPDAILETPWGFVDGTVIAKQWSGVMELHHYPFEGDISSLLPSEAPVIIPPPNTVGYEGSLYGYPVVATDEDIGDVLTHSIDQAPNGIDVDPLSGMISWLNPANEYVGAVSEFNDQCYVVPTGGVTVIEGGEDTIEQGLAVLTPLFKDVKDALEKSSDFTAAGVMDWDQFKARREVKGKEDDPNTWCLGCHVQTQSLVGLGTSINKVEVDESIVDYLADRIMGQQTAEGSLVSMSHPNSHINVQNALGLWSLDAYPDRAATIEARASSLNYMLESDKFVFRNEYRYWNSDHETGWLEENAYATTALISGAGAGLLTDAENGLSFTENQSSAVLGFTLIQDELVEYFLDGYVMPNNATLESAFRLIGLADLRAHIVNPVRAVEIDEAIEFLDAYLRSIQNSDGGWASSPTGSISSPIVSAWVGIALDKKNPDVTDRKVVDNIKFLLDAQGSNGSWLDKGYFDTLLGPTSLVMAYLPIALDFLGNPDLNVAHIDLAEQGDILNLTATISNRGIADTEVSTFVSFYAGEDDSAYFLGQAEIPAIKSGQSATATVLIGDQSLIGTDVFVRVENQEEIEECEVRNNTRRSAVVRHRVTDRSGLFDTQIYALNIEDTNEAPVITSPAEMVHQQAQYGGQQITITDVDVGDDASFTITGEPEGISIDSRTGKLFVDPELIATGEYSFTVVVTDLRGATADQEISFVVEENLPPQIISLPAQQVSEGEEYSYQLEALDPNGDELRYGAELLDGSYFLGSQSGLLRGDEAGPLEGLRAQNDFCTQVAIDSFNVEPVEKWRFVVDEAVPFSTYDQVMQTPIIIPLTDTNEDGVIDQGDDKAIIFMTFTDHLYYRPGFLRAISAKTGEHIWTASDIASVFPAGSLAAGDLDNNGVPEIVAPLIGGGFVVVDNLGVEKWRSSKPANVDWGGASIVDVNQDGIPEILIGNTLISNTGELIFENPGLPSGDNSFGPLSFAADIDLDDEIEIVAGGAIYNSLGELEVNAGDGFSAIGNFDEDEFAEIALVSRGTVSLLDHTGIRVWGPVVLPGGSGSHNRGGPPVIADMTGNGMPEIGVAGGTFYSVFDAQGNLLWKMPTIDSSSNVTGSSVFDFNGDGRSEIVYSDHYFLRIYDGSPDISDEDRVLFSIGNGSGTTYEYPLIADVDDDGHAEIVVIGNDYAFGDFTGIRVFEGSDDQWAPTRSIWNQHAYSISNINDDLSIPSEPQYSWLTHNTFRLNTFADRSALSQSDLAPFELAYNDQTQTLSAVIANRGLAPVSGDVAVTFNGDDGSVLGEVVLGGLEGASEQSVSLTGISPEALTGVVTVSVSTPADTQECISNNNQASARVITLKAVDEGGLFDTQTFLYSVKNVNDAPVITSENSLEITQDQAVDFKIIVEDPDLGDAHSFVLLDDLSGLSINKFTGRIEASANTFEEGLYQFTVQVSDLVGRTAEQVVLLTVADVDNHKPEFTSLPIESASAFTEYTYQAMATDEDGDELVYLLSDKPSGMQIDGITGLIRWIPDLSQVGSQLVDIKVLDARGASENQRFFIDVANPSQSNTPPTITSVPDSAVIAGLTFRYFATADDADGDVLTFSLEDDVHGMAITSDGGMTWLPGAELIGQVFTVTVKVSDGKGGEARQLLSLPVNEPANNPPVINNEPPTSAQQAQPYTHSVLASDSDGDALTYRLETKPAGMNISVDGVITWVPTQEQSEKIHQVSLRVEDTRGAAVIQSFSVWVELLRDDSSNVVTETTNPIRDNKGPIIQGVPTSPAVVGTQYIYDIQAIDPDGDTLTYQLVGDTADGLSISESGVLTWTPIEEQVGSYDLAIAVSDGLAGLTQSFSLDVVILESANNDYPEIVSVPKALAFVEALYEYPVVATDPDNDVLSYSLLSDVGGMTIDDQGLLTWQPAVNQLGTQRVQVAVSDGVLTSLQSFDINVLEPQAVPPLDVFVTASPSVVSPGDSVEIQVFTQGGVSAPVLSADVDGFQVLLDDFGRAVITAGTFGIVNVSAAAVNDDDAAEASTTFLVADASDVTAPTADIASPEPASEVTGTVDIIGTASDDNLVKYELFISPEGAQSWQMLAEGSTSVIDDVLGQIDTTLLMNGQYDLVLQVVDVNSNVSSASTTVLIDDDIKVGNFSFTVEDLVIPMEGIPIQVTRTYDSRRRGEALDFGYGWTIDYQNVKLEESRTLGEGWTRNTVRRGPFGAIADLCVDPLGAPLVTVTLPTGDVEKFEVTASPNCNTYVLFKDVELVFTPVGDTLSKLEALDDANGYFSGSQLVETGFFSNPIDPQRYKLTTQAGFEYFIHKRTGIEKIIDPNGHTLTYTDDGIFHSSGKAVTFERYSDGRIREIIAPNSSKLVYEYDLFNNLEYVTDRDQARTQYTYNGNHGLVDIIDPLGRKVVKNLYDEQGRLYAQEDGNGVVKTFDHDLDARTSLVTDRDGRSTLFAYDESGNVTSETMLISDGSYDEDIVTGYSFDANGNQETKTIGDSTWTADFDDRNNQLFAEDPEQNIIFYRDHNDRGQDGEIEDEMGRISAMDYDVAGNLIVVEMPEVEDPETGELVTPTAGNNINREGKVSSTTDATGFKTTYTYYPKGHDWEGQKETESNAITGTVTFTYDDNNNVKTETRERTVDGVVIEEMVENEYDARDRLTKTTFPDGTYTETHYDLAGNLDKERSRLGFWTDYEYDVYGRLGETLYPDTTMEIRTYTAEGLLETVTDRSGYVTRNEYDDAGRLWKVHNEQDGSFTEMRYTLQGWLEFEWDEKRNKTQHVYDKAGRRTQTIRLDDDGNELVWRYEYYPNGEVQFEIDPLEQTTEYVINALDQRIETRYFDGTVVKERFDFMGRKLGTTDQNEREKTYAYDDAGRMTGVVPKVTVNGEDVPETTYSYDEQGNQLTQMDANDHATHWEYDYFGRVIKRTLPEGMFETFEYRDAENTVVHTDFNGDTITTVSDAMGRMGTVTYSKDGRVESYTYWDNDQVKTATTPEGMTEYFYDERHRLDYEVRADGARMDYGYDLVGNRTLAKATFDGKVIQETRYAFDALNRLHQVFDELATSPEVPVAVYTYDAVGNRDTVTYANGLVTDYDFNEVHQLTDVFTRDADGNLINHFHYALDSTGRRKIVSELSGRTTAYCHDALYRLTEETVFATTQVIDDSCLDESARNDAIYTADYTYDWAGNRTYQTIDGVETLFVYDDNDRLQTQGGYSYGYDDNGNTLTETLDGEVTEFVYNGKNQLASQMKLGVTTEYGYNPRGIRNRKVEGSDTTLYLVDENRAYQQVLVEISNDEVVANYLYGDDLIRQQRAANDSFYHYDGLGSTRSLSDASANITDTYAYAAFGEVLEQTGDTENSYLYTGEQFDQGLNQYYLRARYYDQTTGRFTSMDTWAGRNHDPITLNKYAYGNADPVTYIDPTGNFGLGSIGVSLNIRGVLTTAATTGGRSALQTALLGRAQRGSLGIVGNQITLFAREALFDVLTDAALAETSKAVKGTKAHSIFERKIKDFSKGFNKRWAKYNVSIQAEVFVDDEGDITSRRAKGSLGMDVVVFHNKRPLFALDLKTGKAWSKSQLKKRSARFGNIPIIQILVGPTKKK